MKTAPKWLITIKNSGILIAMLMALLMASGCHSHGDDCDDCNGDYSGRVEGYAFFPYESSSGRYPVYYSSGNAGIRLTLHHQDDDAVEEYITDDDGYFIFDQIRSGTYFVTAYITLYNREQDWHDVYEDDSRHFYVGYNEILVVELYLE